MAVTSAVGLYAFGFRPRMLRWGATDEELARAWPGDELTPRTSGRALRAITINAPAEKVWPWIVQVGQDRAGFYSYTWPENLFLAQMRNTYRIVPEWQARRVGEDFWMAPKHRYGGQARLVVAQLEPQRAMVLVQPRDLDSALKRGYAPHGSWNFLLVPVDKKTTRFIMRSIDPEHLTALKRLGRLSAFEPAHFIMEWKMMRRIKELAEAMR